MVILLSNPEEFYTPIAVADGFCAELDFLNSSLRTYNQLSLLSEKSDTPVDRMHYHQRLSELTNDLESRINRNFKSIDKHTEENNIHQYLYYNSENHNKTSKNKPNDHNNNFLENINILLPEASNPYYCINVFADPFSDNSDRLKHYLMIWKSITDFKPSDKKHFKDYKSYEEMVNNLFGEIDNCYRFPLGKILNEANRTGNNNFNGLIITP